MKKLYLIGDSVRMNYEPFVRRSLEGKVSVYSPEENCRFAAYVYYAVGDWEHRMRVGADLDVVHWNAGLHDAAHIHGDPIVTPPDVYGSYIDRICDRLDDLYPNAVKIFATSTPVREELYTEPWLTRTNAEIDLLNEVALEVLSKRGVVINDLHSVVRRYDPADIFADAVHYNEKGSAILADAVVAAVEPYLS